MKINEHEEKTLEFRPTATGNLTPSLLADGDPRGVATAIDHPWGIASSYQEGPNPLLIAGSLVGTVGIGVALIFAPEITIPVVMTRFAPLLPLLAAACGGPDVIIHAQDNCITHPDIIATDPKLLLPSVKKNLEDVLSTLPEVFCDKVKRIEFIPYETMQSFLQDPPDPNIVVLTPGAVDGQNEMDALGLQHLTPRYDITILYHKKEEVISIDEGCLYQWEENPSTQRQITLAALIGYGMTISSKELMESIVDDLLSKGEKALLKAFGGIPANVMQRLLDSFPIVFAHYIMTGHVMRAIIQHADELKNLGSQTSNDDYRHAASYIERTGDVYASVKKRVFGEREYQVSPIFDRLADADLNSVKAALRGETETLSSPHLQPYLNEASDNHPEAMNAFTLANNSLLQKFVWGQHADSGNFDQLNLLNHYLSVAREEADITLNNFDYYLWDILAHNDAADPRYELSWQILEQSAQYFLHKIDAKWTITSTTGSLEYINKTIDSAIVSTLLQVLLDDDWTDADNHHHHFSGYLSRYTAGEKILLQPIRRARKLCEEITGTECTNAIRTYCHAEPELCLNN